MKINIHRKKGNATGNGRGQFPGRLLSGAGIFAYIILLIMRLLLTDAIGDAGTGLFAPAFEIFFLASLVFAQGMSKTMGNLIRYRVKRQQYRNAKKVFSAGFAINLVFGLLMAVILLLTADRIAQIVCLEEFSRLAVMAAAPAVVLTALTGAFRGCFSGYGIGRIGIYSQYLESILIAVFSVICGRAFRSYGVKVAGLLQRDAYIYLYDALGAMLGVMLAELVTLLFLMVFYILYAGTIKNSLQQDSGKRFEETGELQRILLGGCLVNAGSFILPNLLLLLDQRFFNFCMNRTGQGEVRTALWGASYGKAFALLGIAAACLCLCAQNHVARIGSAYDKEEYHMMRERMDKGIRKLCMLALPVAVYVAVLAQAVATLLFKTQAAYVASVLQKGSAVIALFGFSFFFGQLLIRFRMHRENLVSMLIAFLVHILMLFLLVKNSLLGIEGILIALILFYGVYTVLSFLLLQRAQAYQINWMKSVVFPAVAAFVSGILVLLLSRLLLDSAGALVTILAGCVVGIFVDVILLMVLRVLTEEELLRMPLGTIFVLLGRNTGILR